MPYTIYHVCGTCLQMSVYSNFLAVVVVFMQCFHHSGCVESNTTIVSKELKGHRPKHTGKVYRRSSEVMHYFYSAAAIPVRACITLYMQPRSEF